MAQTGTTTRPSRTPGGSSRETVALVVQAEPGTTSSADAVQVSVVTAAQIHWEPVAPERFAPSLSTTLRNRLRPVQVLCLERAGKYFDDGNNLVNWFLQAMGGWDALPTSLDILGERWQSAETTIIAAAYAGDMLEVDALGAAYVARIVKYLKRTWQDNGKEK